MQYDLRASYRFLGRQRASTAIAVTTLGIGLATSTVAAGVIDHAFWRALPVAASENLLTIYDARPAAPHYQTLSYPDYVAVRERLSGSADVAALVRIESTLGGREQPIHVRGELVSGNYFRVLQTLPMAGRLIGPADDSGDGAVVVLGYDLWRRSFASDWNLVGRSIRLGRDQYTVIGIARPDFRSPAWATSEFWVPLANGRRIIGEIVARPDAPILQTMARVDAASTPEILQSQLAGLDTVSRRDGWRLKVLPGEYLRFWPAHRPAAARHLLMFAAIASAILLVACTNVAGLSAARASERAREIAVRQALGARPLDVFRRLAAEGGLIFAAGTALGLLLAFWLGAFVERIPVPLPWRFEVPTDARLVWIGCGLSLTASLLFLGVSAVRCFKSNLRVTLAASSQTVTIRPRAQRTLAAIQIAVSCVMVTVGGLLARSAWEIRQVDPGFDTADSVMGRVLLRDQGYTAADGMGFYRRLEANLRTRPGIEAVSFGWLAPLGQSRATARLSLDGSAAEISSRYNVVGSGYFRALGIPLHAGRDFDDGDDAGRQPVAIINDVLAERFPSGALGRTIKVASESSPRRIVGIVRSIRYNSLTEAPQPFLYLPLAQAFRSDVLVHVRTRTGAALQALRDEMARIDPNVGLTDAGVLAGQLETALEAPRASALVSTTGAAIAVLLALIGMYGVLSTSVHHRRRELAIRSALGASPQSIVRSVLFEGAALSAAGLLVGMVGSFAAGRLIASQLFAIDGHDPVVMSLAPAIVSLASALAWWVPASRAAAVDPVEVFRQS